MQAQLGQNLIAVSEERKRASEQELIQREVDDVIRKISECERTLALATAGLKFFNDQRKALTDGKFKFCLWHPHKKLQYDEERLNGNYLEQPNK